MTNIRVWAPAVERMRLRTVRGDGDPVDHDMHQDDGGWWTSTVSVADHGLDYGFLLDDDPTPLPDPRSRWQPAGVHGLSRLADPKSHAWTDAGWTGRPLPGAVIYELHIGTFTPEGTFDAALARLPHLVALGVTHVEVLPVNDFNGTHNWGYDGVDWYAVHETYGGPDGFKRFVDACHGHGLAVVLDVVYNHLGPSGNYLPRFGPYLTTGRSTWGDLVNLDGDGSAEVRRYIVDNALMWLSDYHVDGLRLDAVHALHDDSPQHILAEIAAEVDALRARVQRPLTLIAESDLNDPAMVTERSAGGRGMDGQWADDVHHELHALLTGERQGYYCDFGDLPGLAKVFTHAFFHDGTYSTFRERDWGRPVDRALTPGYRFVAFLQDHDQIGNRAQGDRLATQLSPRRLKIGVLLLLSSPFTPMLFMGEEWGARTPWQFFTSHPEPDLGRATAEGRKAEFASHGWSSDEVPDPQDPGTFERSHLDWSEPERPDHAAILDVYRALIALRRTEPELADPRLNRVAVEFDEQAQWVRVHRGDLRVLVNLSDTESHVPAGGRPVAVLFSTEGGFTYDADGVTLPPESGVVVRLLT